MSSQNETEWKWFRDGEKVKIFNVNYFSEWRKLRYMLSEGSDEGRLVDKQRINCALIQKLGYYRRVF